MDAWGSYFTLMMATAFMGYVLPWGQMSFGEQPLLQTYFRLPFNW